MAPLTCDACNKEFSDDADKTLHDKSQWHRHNLKRKMAGVPGVSEALFMAKKSATASANKEKGKKDIEDLDPSCCFMCDRKNDTIERCIVHLHKKHGMFIPDAEYLNDPKGLLTFLGLKVMRDFTCLFCNERCHPFESLEAVRKHMASKSHCKLHYGSGLDDEDDGALEDFYDYSSSYVDEQGKQLVVSGEAAINVELGTGGSELIITKKSNDGRTISTKILGSREFLRYYRQKPRPSPTNNIMIAAVAAALASRSRSMDVVTVQSKKHLVTLFGLKQMNRPGAEAMRSKMAMKSNVIKKLPKKFEFCRKR